MILRKNDLKKAIAILMIFSICCGFMRYEMDMVKQEKVVAKVFSEELLEKISDMDKEDTIQVYIWLRNSDYDEIIEETEENTGLSENGLLEESEILYKDCFVNFEEDATKTLDRFYNDNKFEIEKLSDKTQQFINEERRLARQWYNKANGDFISKYLNGEKMIFKSQYAPMIICELNKDILLSLEDNDLVESVSCYEELIGEDDISIYDSVNSLGGFYNRYVLSANGTGVKVGQFETERPMVGVSDLSGISITMNSGGYFGTHPTKVASIMVGNNGFAPNASLYCTSTISGNYYQDFEWLITNNVNVINVSWGVRYPESSEWGNYNEFDKWVDHISYQHYVTVVKSAGNIASDAVTATTYISSPGMAYNVITVGGVNNNNTSTRSDDTYYSSTSYMEKSNIAMKPDVIAPATNMTFTGGTPSNGTSFAAPHVTGTIAQMLTYCPTLKFRPDAIKAAIMASTDRKLTGESMYSITNKEGAGDMYSYKALPIIAAILSNGTYYVNSSMVQTYSYTATSTGLKKFVLCWLKRVSGSGTDHGTITDTSLSNFDLTIYNSSGNIVASSGFIHNNAELVMFNATKGQTYTVKIKRMTSAAYDKYSLAFTDM